MLSCEFDSRIWHQIDRKWLRKVRKRMYNKIYSLTWKKPFFHKKTPEIFLHIFKIPKG